MQTKQRVPLDPVFQDDWFRSASLGKSPPHPEDPRITAYRIQRSVRYADTDCVDRASGPLEPVLNSPKKLAAFVNVGWRNALFVIPLDSNSKLLDFYLVGRGLDNADLPPKFSGVLAAAEFEAASSIALHVTEPVEEATRQS